MAQQLQAATRTAAEALKSGLNSLQHDLNRAGLMRRLHSSVRVVQAQSLNLVGSLQSGSTGLQNQGQAALRRLEAYAAGMTPRWAGAGSRYVPTWLARLQVAMLRWLMVPWVLAVLACLLLPPLLRRSSILRLLVSAAGVLAAVEAVHMQVSNAESAAAPWSQRSLVWASASLLASVAITVVGGGGREQPALHAPRPPPRRAPSTVLRAPSAPKSGALTPPSRLGMLSPPRLSMNLGRKSIFGGGGGDSAATPGHAADTGHFIVQPTGGFSHQRSPIANLLTRVSGLLLGQSQHMAPPQPPPPPAKPWLDPECRTIDDKFWASPGDLGLKVRGANYLSDKKKELAVGTEMELLSVDLVEVAPTYHIAQHLPSVLNSRAPFMFVMQVMVPGRPTLSLTAVWALPFDPLNDFADDTPFVRNLRTFLEGDDAERSTIFKLIPRIEKGSWVVRQAVGQNTPVLLGRKLTTKYFVTDNYVEVDIDVGSSSTASATVGLVQGAVKGLVIDMAIVLQGNNEDALPESLLGTMRLNHLDLSVAPRLDCDTNTLTLKDHGDEVSPSKHSWMRKKTSSHSDIQKLAT